MDDATIIIFGITGDLAKRKLLPAIYHLQEQGRNILVIGIARSDSNAGDIVLQASKFISKVSGEAWERFRSAVYYRKTDFDSQEEYPKVKRFIEEKEKEHGMSGNRIYYFSTPTDTFGKIAENLSRYGIINKTKNFSRIVFEKPFGHDLLSAKDLNSQINRSFKEDQIYRIDHYLGKELVGNISLMRFTNRFLEPLWNSKNIEHVQIIMTEDIGIEGRGRFYDRHGAIKDVIQNHILQLIALTAMEKPELLTGEHIRDEKVKVLKKTRIAESILGQYQTYKDEPGVEKDSNTETFAALKIEIDTPRWKGVPFYIKTGKALAKKDVSIHLKFKNTECLLTTDCPEDTNYFDIDIQPHEGFSFEINTKIPGEKYRVRPVDMTFHQAHMGENTTEAYEILIGEIIDGDQSLFVRKDEIENSWKIVDPLIKSKKKIHSYASGSQGPKEFIEWSRKHNIKWRR